MLLDRPVQRLAICDGAGSLPPRRRMLAAFVGGVVAYGSMAAPPAIAQTPSAKLNFSCTYTRHKDGSHGEIAVNVRDTGWTDGSDAYIYNLKMIPLDQPSDAVSMFHTIIIYKASGRFISTTVYAGKDGSQVPENADRTATGQCNEVK